MASLNKVMLIGNLTRDPELRVTPAGKSIAQFGMAVSRKTANNEEVTFVDCEAWEKTAELIGKYLAKGSPCFVEGRLKMDQWEDKQTGAKRSKIKLVVESVQFLGKPKDKADEPATDGRFEDEGPRYSAPPPSGNAQESKDDSIPF